MQSLGEQFSLEGLTTDDQLGCLVEITNDLLHKNQALEAQLATLNRQYAMLQREIETVLENGLHLSNAHFETEKRLAGVVEMCDAVGIILDSLSLRLDAVEQAPLVGGSEPEQANSTAAGRQASHYGLCHYCDTYTEVNASGSCDACEFETLSR